MRKTFALLFVLVCFLPLCYGQFKVNSNFPDRKAFLVNNCPAIELSNFKFENAYQDSALRFTQNLSWKNIGDKPIVAFEIVILKYDAFNRRLVGSRWTVSGKDSADWRPLQPGTAGSDGTASYGPEDVYTSIAYIRLARFSDGVIWTASDAELANEFRKLNTGIKEFGDIKPDPKPKLEGK